MRDFGAKGDGSNDLTAFQAAIDAAASTNATVLVPHGTYLINGTLSLKSKVSLEGESATGSIIDLSTPGATVNGVNVDGVTVRNLGFSKPNQDTSMLSFTSSGTGNASHDCLVERCWFTTTSATGSPNTTSLGFYGNSGDGTRCRNMRAIGNYIEYNHSAIILKYGHTRYQAIGNTCVQVGNDSTAEGTKLEYCENSLHNDNTYRVTSACLSAITIMDNVTGLECCNNSFELAAPTYGFKIEGGNSISDVLLSGNFLKGDGSQVGIWNGLGANVDVVITGNDLNGCRIDVSGDRNHVTNNHVYAVPGQAAIRHRGTASRISGNIVRACATGIAGTPDSTLANAWLEVSANTVLDFTSAGITASKNDNILIKDNFLRTYSAASICIWLYSPGSNARCIRNVLDCAAALKQIEFNNITGYAEGNVFFGVDSSKWFSRVGPPFPTIRDLTQQTSGSDAPTSGTWAVGDLVWNAAPSAGGVIGWVCVAAGTPGTWKSFGGISL